MLITAGRARHARAVRVWTLHVDWLHVDGLHVDEVESTESLRQAGDDGTVALRVVVQLEERGGHQLVVARHREIGLLLHKHGVIKTVFLQYCGSQLTSREWEWQLASDTTASMLAAAPGVYKLSIEGCLLKAIQMSDIRLSLGGYPTNFPNTALPKNSLVK